MYRYNKAFQIYQVMKTTYPDKPAKDFNDWMRHIQRQISMLRVIELVNNRQVFMPLETKQKHKQ
jgi:hypothetical protein